MPAIPQSGCIPPLNTSKALTQLLTQKWTLVHVAHPSLLPIWLPSRVYAEGTVWLLMAELLVAVPEQGPGAIHLPPKSGYQQS